VVQDQQPVARPIDIPENVRAQDHRFAAAHLVEQFKGLPAADGVEPGRRFVPNQQFGIIHQGCGYPEAGLHAGRISPDLAPCVVHQADRAQKRTHARVPFPACQPVTLADKREIADG
jgi:hypothetical protein